MKIRVSDIQARGLEVKDKLPLENLNNRMNEGKSNDIVFTVEPEFEIKFTVGSRGIELKGNIKASYQQPCCLCLKELTQNLEVDLDYVLKPKPFESNPIDDIGIIYYKDEHVELEEVMQECLILKLGPFLRPETDADDNCRTCGLNTSKMFEEKPAESIKLGNLLKKAGL